MDTIGKRLAHAIELSGMAGPTVFGMAKISKGALSQWLSDDVSPEHVKAATVRRLCEVLEIRSEWLLDGSLPMRPGGGNEASTEVPIWNARAAAGIGMNNDDAEPIGSILFRTRSLRNKNIVEPHAIYVDGDSMRPRLKTGDTIIYDRADTEIRSGKTYVLDLDGNTVVKRVFVEQDDTLRIVSDNARADPEWRDRMRTRDSVRVAGRMRWIGSWED